MEKLINVICYRVKTPHIYCKGGEEHFEFLACYGYDNKERNKAYIDLLNSDETEKREFCKRHCIDADNIDYFYHHEQEPFDTRD